MARSDDDLENDRPEPGADRESQDSARAAQKDSLERTLREGASEFRFGSLIDGVRPDSGVSSLQNGWTDVLVDAPPRQNPVGPAPRHPRRAVPVIWIAAAIVLLVLVLTEAALLFVVAARLPKPTLPAQLPTLAAARPAPTAALQATPPTAGAATLAPRATSPGAPRMATVPPASRIAVRKTAFSAPRRQRRPRRAWVRRRIRRIHPSAGERRSGPPIAGHSRGDGGRANAIIDRLPQ